MTMFCDRDIVAAIEEGDIEVRPFDREKVQPSSIDLMLGNVFYRLNQYHEHPNDERMVLTVVDPKVDQSHYFTRMEVADGESLTIYPGQCILACTKEYVRFGKTVAGRLEGKSSLGRLFLAVHITAGFFDPGFCGYPTLELVAHAPIKLYPGMPVAQMSFFRLSGVPRHLYGDPELHSKYQDQPAEPVLSKYHRNFDQEVD